MPRHIPHAIRLFERGNFRRAQSDRQRGDWDESGAFRRSSADMFAEYRELAQQPGASPKSVGEVGQTLAGAARTLEATYEFPYLSHASMEPLNCVVRISADECEVWNSEQFQRVDQTLIERVVGLPPAKVTLHQLYAGGSFGRRANPVSDYLIEAATIAKVAGFLPRGSNSASISTGATLSSGDTCG